MPRRKEDDRLAMQSESRGTSTRAPRRGLGHERDRFPGLVVERRWSSRWHRGWVAIRPSSDERAAQTREPARVSGLSETSATGQNLCGEVLAGLSRLNAVPPSEIRDNSYMMEHGGSNIISTRPTPAGLRDDWLCERAIGGGLRGGGNLGERHPPIFHHVWKLPQFSSRNVFILRKSR